MEANCKISGLFPAMITPFHSNQTIDFQSMAEVIDFFIESGVQGLYVMGTTGEWPLISKEQRMAVLEFVMGFVKGRIPVMAHIGALPVQDACELAAHAEMVGVSAISSIPPYYFPFTEADIENYYDSILASVSEDLPLLFYNIPGFARNVISVETLKRLKTRHPNIGGVKDSQGDPEVFKNYVKEVGADGVVLIGSDDLILHAFQMGGSGMISGNANVVPELFIQLMAAYKKGKIELATRLQELVNKLAAATHFGRVPLLKTGLGLRGVSAGSALKPYSKKITADEIGCLKLTIQQILQRLSDL
jgi:dihydrodipicolinate synthase/N-acetylneuraminate lyase